MQPTVYANLVGIFAFASISYWIELQPSHRFAWLVTGEVYLNSSLLEEI